MDVSNFWWQAAEAPAGPGNSLRFTSGQQLTGHTGGSGTASVWIKRAKLGAAQTVMPGIAFDTSDKLNGSTALFRDPSAWMHVVVNSSGTYVNGVSVGAGSAISAGTIGAGCELYLAEFRFIDGQALDPTNFGAYDANDVWTPKEYTGTYGANGFYLDFSDPADIGADRSGNGNDFTPSGFELGNQTSVLWDHMEDSPSQNYATLNPLISTSGSNIKDANLLWDSSDNKLANQTIALPTTGKHYCEFNVTSSNVWIGVTPVADPFTRLTSQGSNANQSVFAQSYFGNRTYTTNSQIISGAGGSMPTPGVMGIAYDADAGTFEVFDNGVSKYVVGNSTIDAPYYIQLDRNSTSTTTQVGINFGQQPFRFTPPAVFKPLQTQNLPAAPIPNGRDHFQAITDTGANILTAAQTAFPNGLWWIKDRVNSNQHQFVDSVRGANVALTTPTLGAEAAYAAPAGNSVAWCWNAPDSFTSSAGTGGATIASSGRRNVAAGFSIVSYTGAGDTTARVGHGLSQVPEIVIAKSRESGDNWMVYTGIIDGTPDLLVLNLSQAKVDGDANFELPTATWFNPGNNLGAEDYVAYCWHSVPGYSAFGSYTGNGTDMNGPFIYTGFSVCYVMVKCLDSAQSWAIRTAMPGAEFNPIRSRYYADSSDNPGDGNSIDFLSNGFKPRNNGGLDNLAGKKYIYMAFGKNPFGGKNVSPANAR